MNAIPRSLIIFGRIALLLVWIYEGLIAKLGGQRADEQGIAEAVPLLPDHLAGLALRALGGYEVLLGVWVLIGLLPRIAATLQTLTLIAVSSTGLLFGREQIGEPLDLVIKNLALIALVWLVAAAASVRTDSVRDREPADG
ncbi:DoxX-like family protein [Microlunatus soli]|uniref:DoxX-like family protein n=1 Tax=Microlunatus soli TaxID=630515 RepID=A0A1H1NLL2_9ACTN|nr:DoxX-like family protein [Microlunatus soli]SDR99884.1 DoxX-like family protein [Microlunatus soli]